MIDDLWPYPWSVSCYLLCRSQEWEDPECQVPVSVCFFGVDTRHYPRQYVLLVHNTFYGELGLNSKSFPKDFFSYGINRRLLHILKGSIVLLSVFSKHVWTPLYV